MKRIQTIQELMTFIALQKQVVIYGAGRAGKSLRRFLKDHAVSVSSFAVTEQGGDGALDGVPVRCLDAVSETVGGTDACILLAAAKANRRAMREELEKRRVCAWAELSGLLLYEMEKENRRADARAAEESKVYRDARDRIGYLSPGYMDTDYAEKRLIVGKIENASYMAVPKETADLVPADTDDENSLAKYRQMEEACYCPRMYVPQVKWLHTFNAVCQADIPWCASFETSIPRVACETENEKKYYLQLAEYMKKPGCRALFALSQNAYDIQKSALEENLNREDVKLLMKKTRVLHPPQDILVSSEEFERKHNSEKIRFIFVGGAFFIKGGREAVETLSEFAGQYDFDLTLISSLQYGDYFTQTSYDEMMRCKKNIRECPWIDYYESLPNEAVLMKCKEATVGLLPSIADTYGYAVLEMQAAGCPVVTTNVRAFPETNNEKCGWICRMPVDELGFCREQKTEIWSAILRKELRRCFEDIFNHPDRIREKGRMALEQIIKLHDPRAYQRELQRLSV